jgi:hypothetical protein
MEKENNWNKNKNKSEKKNNWNWQLDGKVLDCNANTRRCGIYTSAETLKFRLSIKLQKTPCFGPNMKIPLDKSNEFGPQGMKNIKPMTKVILEENYFCTLGYSRA